MFNFILGADSAGRRADRKRETVTCRRRYEILPAGYRLEPDVREVTDELCASNWEHFAMSQNLSEDPDAISVRGLRACGAQEEAYGSRCPESRGLMLPTGRRLQIPTAETKAPPTTSDDQLLVVICHHGARSQMVVDFLETPALTTQSTSTAASMLGLRYRPINAALSIAFV